MTIEIEALEFTCIIGILPHERTKAQRVILDMRITYDYKEGAFLDYAQIVAQSEALLKEKRFHLIEEALEALQAMLLKQYPVIEHLYIKLSKPDILPHCRVSVATET